MRYVAFTMDDYESFLRSELEAAQVKTRETQRALELFLTWRSSHPGALREPSARRVREGNSRHSSTQNSAKRASKLDVIFVAFEAAGPDGLSQDDVQRIAAENGISSSPASLRSFCWTAKSQGRLISLAPGRYAIAPMNEAAPRIPDNGDGDAASTRLDNNHHREGDEGGGT